MTNIEQISSVLFPKTETSQTTFADAHAAYACWLREWWHRMDRNYADQGELAEIFRQSYYRPMEFEQFADCGFSIPKKFKNHVVGHSVVFCRRKNCDNWACQSQRMRNSFLRVARIGLKPLAFLTLTWPNVPFEMALLKTYYEEVALAFRKLLDRLEIRCAVQFVEVTTGFVPGKLHPHIHAVVFCEPAWSEQKCVKKGRNPVYKTITHNSRFLRVLETLQAAPSKKALQAGINHALSAAWTPIATELCEESKGNYAEGFQVNVTPLSSCEEAAIEEVLRYACKYATKTEGDVSGDIHDRKRRSRKIPLKGFRNFSVVWNHWPREERPLRTELAQSEAEMDYFADEVGIEAIKPAITGIWKVDYPFDLPKVVRSLKAKTVMEYVWEDGTIKCKKSVNGVPFVAHYVHLDDRKKLLEFYTSGEKADFAWFFGRIRLPDRGAETWAFSPTKGIMQLVELDHEEDLDFEPSAPRPQWWMRLNLDPQEEILAYDLEAEDRRINKEMEVAAGDQALLEMWEESCEDFARSYSLYLNANGVEFWESLRRSELAIAARLQCIYMSAPLL